jgi:hypothetical protein
MVSDGRGITHGIGAFGDAGQTGHMQNHMISDQPAAFCCEVIAKV